MGKIIKESIIPVLTNSFIYFLFSIISSNVLADKGCVRISGVYNDDNIWQKNIELVNYTNHYHNDIYLKLPSSAKIENENFISTLLIEAAQIKSHEYNLYNISQIQPKSSTVIVISLQDKSDKIQFTNLREKKFVLEEDGKIASPRIKLLKQLLPSFMIYIFLLFISQLIERGYFSKKFEELEKKTDKQKHEREELNKRILEMEQDVKVTKKNILKRDFFFKKQLSDYQKENEFWRNTIRQLLYNGDKKNSQAEHIFEIITNNLQTYTVKSKANLDLNEILFLADEIEKNNDKENY